MFFPFRFWFVSTAVFRDTSDDAKNETYVWMRNEYLSFISITLLFLVFLSRDGLKADLHHDEGEKTRCF